MVVVGTDTVRRKSRERSSAISCTNSEMDAVEDRGALMKGSRKAWFEAWLCHGNMLFVWYGMRKSTFLWNQQESKKTHVAASGGNSVLCTLDSVTSSSFP